MYNLSTTREFKTELTKEILKKAAVYASETEKKSLDPMK